METNSKTEISAQSKPKNPFKITRVNPAKKENIAKPPVVAFRCNEEPLVFHDFDPLLAYSKDLILTNVTTNFCSVRFEPLDKKIAHYFELKSEPSGKIAPGKQVKFRLTFYPQQREDIESQLFLRSETGPFSIPFSCRYRKTQVIISAKQINLGKIIKGERAVQTLTLRNEGGLSTNYYLKVAAGEPGGDREPADQRLVKDLKIPSNGKLTAYSKTELSFEFNPKQIGTLGVTCNIIFEQAVDQPPIDVKISSECIEYPIKSSQEVYDIGILLLGEVYREKIILINSSEHNSRIELFPPKELENFLNFSPISGNISPQGTFGTWMRIEVGHELLKYNKPQKFLAKAKSTIQQDAIHFWIQFQVSDDTLIYPQTLDFGEVTERTSKALPLKLENRSLLPQQVLISLSSARLALDPPVNVILIAPGEHALPYLIFRANSAGETEDRSIKLRVITGKEKSREIWLNVRGRVISNPLKVSAHRLDFPPVPVDQIVQHFISVHNTSAERLEFCFNLPDKRLSGLSIEPSGAIIASGAVMVVLIQFRPRDIDNEQAKANYMNLLSENDEQVKLLNRDIKEARTFLEKSNVDSKMTAAKKEKLEEQRRFFLDSIADAEVKLKKRLECLLEKADLVQLCRTSGGRIDEDNEFKLATWVIPIFTRTQENKGTLPHISYFEIHTAVQPKNLVSEKQEVKFGEVPIFGRKVEKFSLKNEGDNETKVQADPYSLGAVFSFLSKPETIPQKQTRQVALAFEPISLGEFSCTLELKGDCPCQVNVSGKGVTSLFDWDAKSVEDLGACLVNEKIEKRFKLTNKSSFPFEYTFRKLESIGTTTDSSLSCMDIFPSFCALSPGETREVQVVFWPKEQGGTFAEKFDFDVQGAEERKTLTLIARCTNQLAYAEVLLDAPEPASQALYELLSEANEFKNTTKKLLVRPMPTHLNQMAHALMEKRTQAFNLENRTN